jgi:RimJ/RimL family protein N-acetyltransferase
VVTNPTTDRSTGPFVTPTTPRYVPAVAPSAPAGLPTIRTERLVLRDWRDDDLEPFARINADPEVMAHFPAVLSRTESDGVVERIRRHAAAEGFSLWAVEVVDGGDEVGFCGFTGIISPPFVVPGRIEPGVAEIGWRLARWAWGHGFATEAASAVLDRAFRVLDLPEVVSFTVAANHRSQAVMERIGLTRSPERDFGHPRWEPSWGTERRRHLVWSVGRDPWLALVRPRRAT